VNSKGLPKLDTLPSKRPDYFGGRRKKSNGENVPMDLSIKWDVPQ
jgi:hypothetical protein